MTNHVRDLLPLWVGEDLSPHDMQRVQAHLDQCPACRAEAQALLESRDWLAAEDPLPFSFEERLDLRRDIMAAVRQEARPLKPRRNITPWLAGAAAVVLALLPLARRGSVPTPVVPVAPNLPNIASVEPPQTTVPGPQRTHAARTRRAPESTAPSTGLPTRIEFQTADPNIRIIWLTQSAVARAEPRSTTPPETTDPIEPTT